MKMKSQHKKSPQKSLQKSPKDVTPEHNATAPGFFAQPEQQPGQEQEIGRTLTSPARAAGINAYLTKPVRESHLFDCLRTAMGQQPRLTQDSAMLITHYTRAEVHNQKQPRILVVEDNVINQKLIVRLLEKLGYHADVAGNGEEALKALSQREAAPDRLTPAFSSLLPTEQTSQAA